jgi:hypothetical protein
MSETHRPSIRKAAEYLQLASHHLVDDHHEWSRRWTAKHLCSAAAEMDLSDEPPARIRTLLALRTGDWEVEAPSRELIWEAYDEMSELLQASRPGPRYWLRQQVPRLWRDLGVVLLVLLALGISYRKYHHYPVNLWSDRYEIMDIAVIDSSQGYGQLQINQTVDRKPVMINGQYHAIALGTHAASNIQVALTKTGRRFNGGCGYPDTVAGARIVCIVEQSGRELYRGPVLSSEMRLALFEVPVTPGENVRLRVESASEGITAAHAVWFGLKVSDE